MWKGDFLCGDKNRVGKHWAQGCKISIGEKYMKVGEVNL
jgi:hypothetical protein